MLKPNATIVVAKQDLCQFGACYFSLTTDSKVQELWKWFFVVLLAAQICQKNAVQNLFTEFKQLFLIMTKKHKNYSLKDVVPGSAA